MGGENPVPGPVEWRIFVARKWLLSWHLFSMFLQYWLNTILFCDITFSYLLAALTSYSPTLAVRNVVLAVAFCFPESYDIAQADTKYPLPLLSLQLTLNT